MKAPDPLQFARPDISAVDVEAVGRVLHDGWLTSGRECEQLEEELAAYLGAAHVVSMSSATTAMETAFAWLGLPTGARVGVPTWTFVSSALAPMRLGGVPVLLDIEPSTLNISATALQAALDQGLDAVVAVHFAGEPVAAAVHDLCGAAGVPIVEDAAHALGARDHRGMVAGQGSVAACLSFYATKNLTSGEGGALVTDNQELARFARAYRLHGLSRDSWTRDGAGAGYDIVAAGIKANLSDILAALARSQLARFAESQARRRQLVQRYRASLAELQCGPIRASEGSADHLMVVVLPLGADRRKVVADLAGQGVPTSIHFQPLHHFGWLAERSIIGPWGTPVADAMAGRALSLPLHVGLSFDDVDRVCHALATSLA